MDKKFQVACATSELNAAYADTLGYRAIILNKRPGIHNYRGYIQWKVDEEWRTIYKEHSEDLGTLITLMKEKGIVPWKSLPVWKSVPNVPEWQKIFKM